MSRNTCWARARVRASLWCAVLGLGVGVLGACSDDERAALMGDWAVPTVNGLVPGSLAQGCDLAGYETIRLVLFKPDSNQVVQQLSQSCDIGGFDTFPETVVRFGTYDAEWQALDRRGVVLDSQRFPIVIRDFYTQVPGADFEPFRPLGDDVSFAASWKIRQAGASLAERCAAAAVHDVSFAVFADDNTTEGVEIRRVACSTNEQPDGAGRYVSLSPEVAFGRYLFQWRFLDAEGNLIGASPKKLWEASVTGARIYDLGMFEFPPL